MALGTAERGEEDPLLPTSAAALGLSSQSWIGIFTASRVFSVHSSGHAAFDMLALLYASLWSFLPTLVSITILL